MDEAAGYVAETKAKIQDYKNTIADMETQYNNFKD